MKNTLKTIGVVLLTSVNAIFAQDPGSIDATFGSNGFTFTDHIANTGESYWDMTVLSDDKIIKVGNSYNGNQKDIIISKFNEDGTPDVSFGTNGIVSYDLLLNDLDEEAKAVYVTADSMILVSGFMFTNNGVDGFLMRLNPDGSMDATFGDSPYSITMFNSGDNTLSIGSDIEIVNDKIYVGATTLFSQQTDMCLYKFSIDGVPDVSFANSGVANIDIDGENDVFTSMDVTSNGNFVLAGSSDSSGVVRGVVSMLNSFGLPFGFGGAGNGGYTFDFGSGENQIADIYVNDNNEIFATGSAGVAPNTDGFIMKFTNSPLGELDNTFSGDGAVFSDPGMTTGVRFTRIHPTWDGGVVSTGYTFGLISEIHALMLDETGSANSDFNGNGLVSHSLTISVNTNGLSASCGALQSNGAILIGGNLSSQDFIGKNMFMVRLLPTMDNASIEENEKFSVTVFPNPTSNMFKIESDNIIKSVQLINLQGESAMCWKAQQSQYDIPSEISSGTYFIQVETSVGVAKGRLNIIK